MKTLVVLALLTLSTALALRGKDIKSRNVVVPAGRLEGRIVRGRQAFQGQFPYIVGLKLRIEGGAHKRCGGSLLNHRTVLTAAHCTKDIFEALVFLGVINLGNVEPIYRVSPADIIIHEGYNKDDYFVNDISLIKIPYTKYTRNIQPVKLPAMSRSYSSYIGKDIIVAGWGFKEHYEFTDELQYAQLGIIDNEMCNKHWRIYPTQLCTSVVGGVNTCSGDSGGPLVLPRSRIQIGLVSFGTNCLTSLKVHTRITSYLEWIIKHGGGSH